MIAARKYLIPGILILAAGCNPMEPEPTSLSFAGYPIPVQCIDGLCEADIVARNDGPGCFDDPWGNAWLKDASGKIVAIAAWSHEGRVYPGEHFVTRISGVPALALATASSVGGDSHWFGVVCRR